MYLDHILVPFQKTILAGCLLTAVVMLIWAAAQAKVDGDMPNIFPEEHNQYNVIDLKDGFESISAHYPPVRFDVCYVSIWPPSWQQVQWCDLSWCFLGSSTEITYQGDVEAANASTCACRLNEERGSNCTIKVGIGGDPIRRKVSTRFVGLDPDTVPEDFWSSDAWKDHVQTAMNTAHGREMRYTYYELNNDPTFSSYISLPRLVQQHWESGFITTMPYSIAPEMTLELESVPPGEAHCDVHQVCYCGAPTCTLMEESPLANSADQDLINLEIPKATARRLQPQEDAPATDSLASLQVLAPAVASDMLAAPLPRPLAPQAVHHHARRLVGGYADVNFVWGIKVEMGKPLLGNPQPSELWEYDTNFVPSSTAAQRQLLRSCRYVEDNEDYLNVELQNCWIVQFRDWVRRRDPPELFPVRAHEFNNLLRQWSRSAMLPTGAPAKDFMWFDQNEDLIATYFRFDLSLNYAGTDAGEALDEKAKWDGAVGELQDGAPPDADGLFHTSRLWIRASAEQAIINGTVATLVLSIACGFFGTLAFTRNIVISIFVIMAVIGVTSSLAFFMVVLMGWTVGVIEVLGLIVFVGYSITYSLHVAHRYVEHVNESSITSPAERREDAVRSSLRAMSSAVIGSAVTTLGSSFFLFFTILVIFYKLAAVLFAVTFFAAAFALIALPAALLVAGPFGMCGFGCAIDRFAPERRDPGLKELRDDDLTPSMENAKSVKSQVYIAPSSQRASYASPAPPRPRAATDGTIGAATITSSSRSPSAPSLHSGSAGAAQYHPTGHSLPSSSIAAAVALAASASPPTPSPEGARNSKHRPRPPPLNSTGSHPGVLGRTEDDAMESIMPEPAKPPMPFYQSPVLTPLASTPGHRPLSSAYVNRPSVSGRPGQAPRPANTHGGHRSSKNKPVYAE